jgi:RecJ-like exonuclease
MTFATTCPSCNGTGGLKSLTLGLDAAGMLKQMEENKKTQCGTCAGKGTVWVQIISPPQSSDVAKTH